MDQSAETDSFSLLGVRVDIATLAECVEAIWASAATGEGLRVVLVDLWTLLLAQREYAVWEALSTADYVLAASDDAVLRRVTKRQHIPAVEPEALLNELLSVAAHDDKRVAVLAPPDELTAEVALLQHVWPKLAVSGVESGAVADAGPNGSVVGALNAAAPDLLIIGGSTPWKERWLHAHRAELEVGAVVLVPALPTALGTIGHRAGLPVPGFRRLRRQATVQRAMATTIAPVATASAAAVSTAVTTWLHEAREGISDLSAAIHARPQTTLARRLGVSPHSTNRRVAVRVSEWRETQEHAAIPGMGRLGTSPLARLGPPRRPTQPRVVISALPPAPPIIDELDEWADQPTINLAAEALRAAVPGIITGYIVDSIETEDPWHAPRSVEQEPSTPTDLPTREAVPSDAQQWAPTMRLRPDRAAGSHAPSGFSHKESDTRTKGGPSRRPTSADPLPGSPDEPPPTQRLRRPAEARMTEGRSATGHTSEDPPASLWQGRISRSYVVRRVPRRRPRRRSRLRRRQ